jgi:hypothetical protein
MNRLGWMKLAVAIVALLVTVSAVAAENSAKVALQSPMHLNGTQLAAGTYSITWTGTGTEVQVTFRSGKRDVATLPAKLAERPAAPNRNSVVHDQSGKLLEIALSGNPRWLFRTRPRSQRHNKPTVTSPRAPGLSITHKSAYAMGLPSQPCLRVVSGHGFQPCRNAPQFYRL